MTNNDQIHFVITWWTIDSYYNWIKDTAVTNEHSVLPKYIDILKLYEECIFTEVCMKDSRELTEDDKKNILNTVTKSKAKRIIITHWTYTLPDTARYLDANLNNTNKTIIFVCSMIPLVWFTPTDAWFNIGYAVAKSQELKKWIYICMNWRIFTPHEVIKILSEWRFGSIYTK